MLGVLIAVALVGLVATWNGDLLGAFLLSLTVALAAGAGKLAFDSLVQRDAPDANYGRSFARFEARFQLTWVIGAFIPVVLPFRARYGYALVTLAAAGAAVSYIVGVRTAGRAPAPAAVPSPGRTEPGVDATGVLTRPDPTLIAPWPPEDPLRPAAPGTPPAAGPSGEWGSISSTPVVSAGEGVHVERTRRADAERDA